MTVYEFNLEESAGRLDKFLAGQVPAVSRSKIQQLIEEGRVKVNMKKSKSNYKLEAGDHVWMDYEEEVLMMQAEEGPLDILYEDQDIIVLNKESGLVVHPAPGHSTGTLANRLLAHTEQLSDLNGEFRPGIVHRLDKDTSGLMIIAKTNEAHAVLSQQFKDHQPLREYLALVHGRLQAPEGTIDLPLGRDPQHRTKYAVVPGGKPSVTHFKVDKFYKQQSLVRARLETGRSHQIRIHFNYLEHTVYGDRVYGSPVDLGEGKHCLHAHQLGFKHPRTGDWMEFLTPLPDFFQQILDDLVPSR